jgi:hypothetical protein
MAPSKNPAAKKKKKGSQKNGEQKSDFLGEMSQS